MQKLIFQRIFLCDIIFVPRFRLKGADVKTCVNSNDGQIDLSGLSETFHRELLYALNKGALSRSEELVETLEEGKHKTWLIERLSRIDFPAIRNAIAPHLHSVYS